VSICQRGREEIEGLGDAYPDEPVEVGEDGFAEEASDSFCRCAALAAQVVNDVDEFSAAG
jgi:hypothetical protein